MEIKEEIKKVLSKITGFFGGIWQIFCLFIALLLVWYLAGVSLKYTLPLIICFWVLSEFSQTPKARKVLALILKAIVIIALIYSAMAAYFPRINGKTIIMRASIDQKISSSMGNNVDINAKDRWEATKEKKSKEFFIYYQSLLDEGKTKEAADTLARFKRIWDEEWRKDENQAKQSVPSQNASAASQPINTSSASKPIASNFSKDSIFTKGTYLINVKGETPFNLIIKPSKKGCARYSLSSDKYKYQILVPGENPIQGSPNAILAYREEPKFKLSSQEGDSVKLVVN